MSKNQGNNTNQHFFAAEAAVKSNGIESTHTRESGQDDSMEISKERNNTQNSSCSDRKRNRRTMADDGSLDDILGQSKYLSNVCRYSFFFLICFFLLLFNSYVKAKEPYSI